jgi:adenosylcobinamide hydrolase
MISGVSVSIDADAVVVRSDTPLVVLSSAVFRGGLVDARAVINLAVPKDDPCVDPPAMLAAFARGRAVGAPFVGLLTSARTADATTGETDAHGHRALAVVTVGLGNRSAAGQSVVARWASSTINIIVVVDADPEPAALVNAVITVTEVKALALAAAGITTADGSPASGTSTDAVVIAATGRGPRARFGGPSSELGWTVARAARLALDAGIARWQERHA